MAASYADNEIWHVMIADDMKRMNVDQLDDAFRLSLVDASTMVWKAGMKTWQSLGAVAGIDDEPEDSITRMVVTAPPPPPRPLARPAPKPPSPRSLAPARPAPNPFLAAPAPVFQQSYAAPAPVMTMPKPLVAAPRRAAIDSDVDFRGKSRGIRWGRWLVALVLLTGGVLGAYRQNLLREGARRIGVEGRYLYGEHRVTEYVGAKAPYTVKSALTRLKLLPGPNAVVAAPVLAKPEPRPEPKAVMPAPAPKPTEDPSVKTVSLDALPVLTVEEPSKQAPAATPVVHTVVAPKTKASVAVTKPEKVAKSEPKPRAEPRPKAEPKPKAAAPAPVANDNPLKAAIRSAIAADAAKK